MTSVQTLREPQTKRLTGNHTPHNLCETGKPKTPMDWYDMECRTFIEGQKQDGVPDDEIITLPEIVAMCKEIRAEMYEEEQKIANNH